MDRGTAMMMPQHTIRGGLGWILDLGLPELFAGLYVDRLVAAWVVT